MDLFIAKLRQRDTVSDEEEKALRAAVSRVRPHAADKTLVRSGDELSESLLVTEGLVCRHKELRTGERQILELNLPGDFIDLHGFVLKRIDHSLTTLTPCTIASVPHERLKEITETMPHLARLLWLQTALDAAIHREWVMTLGQKSAIARLAQLFCELHVRMQLIGQVTGNGFDLPLTQTELAEVTGLTPVHVNRTLRALRDEGLVSTRNGRVDILNLPALQRVADFDPTYLNVEQRPR